MRATSQLPLFSSLETTTGMAVKSSACNCGSPSIGAMVARLSNSVAVVLPTPQPERPGKWALRLFDF